MWNVVLEMAVRARTRYARPMLETIASTFEGSSLPAYRFETFAARVISWAVERTSRV